MMMFLGFWKANRSVDDLGPSEWKVPGTILPIRKESIPRFSPFFHEMKIERCGWFLVLREACKEDQNWVLVSLGNPSK